MTFVSLIGDFVLLNLLYVAGFCLYLGGDECLMPRYLLFYAYLNLSWLILVLSFGAHRINRNTRKKTILFTYIRIIVFFFFFFLMYFQLTPLSYFPRDYIGYLFVAFFALLVFWKILLYYLFLMYRKWGFNFRNVAILGYTKNTARLANYFTTNKWHGYRFLGYFDNDHRGERILGRYTDLKKYIETRQVDELYIAIDHVSATSLPSINEVISEYPVKVRIVPDLGNFTFKSAELISYGTLPVLKIHNGPLGYWYNRLIKRIFDLLLSVVVIAAVLSWMIPLLWIASLFGSREGIFFTQKRTRIDGRTFTCIKFRSMKKNAEADHLQAAPGDCRVTPVGRFLRKFSLDELPQFFNVFMGQMSTVGPRPHMLKHTEEYRRMVKRFMVRHTIKPGITGLAQVNGYRGEIKNREDIANRVKFDVNYLENWSLNLDIKIMLITAWLILRGKLLAY